MRCFSLLLPHSNLSLSPGHQMSPQSHQAAEMLSLRDEECLKTVRKVAWYPLFAHARKTPRFHGVSYTIVYEPLPYSSEARPSRAYLANMAGKSEDFDKALKFALCCIGKGDFTLKAEQLDAIKYIYDGKDV